MARRSRLTSWVILGLLITAAVLIPSGLAAPGTLIGLGAASLCLMIALVLNRIGQVSAAGMLLVLMISGAVLYAIASASGGLALVYLPAFDLLVISVVVAASVLPSWATFATAALNIALIVLAFYVAPHAPDVDQALATFGVAAMVSRPIALQVIVAVIAFLWVRGTNDAIRRADRAEELAALEHQLAEQKRQLDIGIQQLLATHIRAANGDFTARAPLRQENVLWQIASSLNNLLARMQRTAQAEHKLVRTEEELRRIAGAIDEARAGRPPFWPLPTGTAADLILERIARDQRRPVPTAPYEAGRLPAGLGAPSLTSRPAGGSPYGPGAGPGYGQGFGPSQMPAGPSQPLGGSPFGPGGLGGFGSQQPSSQPVSQSPFGPGAPQPPSTPLGQSPQTGDRWQAPVPTRPSEPAPGAPWMLSQEELARESEDQTQGTPQAGSQAGQDDVPQDWPELPPVGQWTAGSDDAQMPAG